MSNDFLWVLGGVAALVFFGMDTQASSVASPSSSSANTSSSNSTIGSSGLTPQQLTQVFSANANADVPANIIAAILAAPNAAAATAIENSWLTSLTPSTPSLTDPYYTAASYPTYENGQLFINANQTDIAMTNWQNQHMT